MNPLLSFPPGWNLNVPAGTLLIRADVVMNQRPGPGGYAAIIEASDVSETKLLRGGIPDATTDDLIRKMVRHLAHEIKGNRAVILTRSPAIGTEIATLFKRFKMIRMVLNSPLAVADATRHAAVMAERADQTKEVHDEQLNSERYSKSEDYSEAQDTSIVHEAIQKLIDTVKDVNLNNSSVSSAAQSLLDAAEGSRLARQRQALHSLTANDVVKKTKD